jgi:hypothetical protein
MEGATEKVSLSIMPKKTNYNNIFSFNEQKHIFWALQKSFKKYLSNEGKSTASSAPGGSIGPRYVLIFYLVKNHKIANNSVTQLKISTYLESLELKKWCIFD